MYFPLKISRAVPASAGGVWWGELDVGKWEIHVTDDDAEAAVAGELAAAPPTEEELAAVVEEESTMLTTSPGWATYEALQQLDQST